MGIIYTQLSLEERAMIHTQLERGINPAAIARGLNRSASTRSPNSVETAGRDQRRVAALNDLRWQAATVPTRPGRTPMPARSHRALRAACDQEPRCGIRSPAT